MSIRGNEYGARVRRLGVELWSEGRGPILLAVAGGWFLSLGVRMIYPAVLPQLRAAYGMDLTLAGMLITALWVAYALGQLPGGILDDRFGGGRVLVASTGISALALVLVVTAGSVGVLFGATIVFGFATALYGVARFTILTTNYPDHGGTAIGLTMAAGDLGNTVLPPVAGALAAAIAWEFGLGVTIPLFLVATVVLYVVLLEGDGSSASREIDSDGTIGGSDAGDDGDDALSDGAVDDSHSDGGLEGTDSGRNLEETDSDGGLGETVRSIARAMRSRPVLTVAAIQTLGYCVWQAFTGFYPTYLIESKGLEPTTATVLFGGFFALGTVVKPIAGSTYDTYGLRRSLPVLLLAITATMFVLPFAEGLVALVAVTALASSLLGYGTITLTYLTNSLPEDVQGTGLGTLRTSYMLIGAASPTVVGVLADADYFDEAFFLLAAVAAVAALLSVLVPHE